MRSMKENQELQEAPPRSSQIAEMPSAPTQSQIAAGEKPPRFVALRSRNFRLFWMGNLLSNVGTFAQQTAQGWLVRTITPDPNHAAANLSLVAACGTLPILLFTLYAGVLADRVDKRRALVITNASAAIIAVLLAILVSSGHTQVWHVALLALCTGLVNAFDIPIRQSFNREMVPLEDLPNAIALNSSAFNAARVAGPAVGGLLLRSVGLAACFWVNAFSFGAMIAALACQKMTWEASEKGAPSGREVWEDVRAGFDFVKENPTLRVTTILIAWLSFSTMSFGTLLPLFAKDIFHSDEAGFALLMTCNGVGALASAVVLAVAGQMRHKGKRLLLGSFCFALSVAAFALAPNLYIGCFWLILAGCFLLTSLMTSNTMVQTIAPDELRGRVFSIYSLALIGTAPLGAISIGTLAHYVGAPHAVAGCALSAAAFCFAVFVRYRRTLWKEK